MLGCYPYLGCNTAGPRIHECARVGFFMRVVWGGELHVTSPYDKPFLEIDEQIALLESRGLAVEDHEAARKALLEYGYYRISGYSHPLRKYDLASGKYKDDFREGACLSHPINLIEFDRGLRSLFLVAAERIEIALRVRVAILLGQRGPWSHRDAGEFKATFGSRPNKNTNEIPFDVWLEKLIKLEKDSKEQFAVHFRGKYSDPPPVWVSIELWDFGMLSRLIGGMKPDDLDTLAGYYSLPLRKFLPSWIRAINHIRNVAAHHSRLWNRSPVDQPVPPKDGEVPILNHLAGDTFAQTRLYAVAAVTQFLLRQIHADAAQAWSLAMKDHFASFPDMPGVPVEQTGFPNGWRDLELWK